MSYAETNAEVPRLAPPVSRPDNLTALVFTEIRDQIVDASLPPGSSVSEASLAERLQVSKTPVREALLRLRHIGLVEPGGRGLRVVQPSITGIRDAFEFRAGLEALSGRHAANRSTPEQQERILDLAVRSRVAAEAHDEAAFLRCDQAFHLAIADAARNGVLREAVGNSIILTRALRRRDLARARDFLPDAREHVGIAEIIQAGSPELAASRLADHIHRIMLDVLGIDSGPAPA